jgi:predicted nucleic acid-binding protein
MFVVIRAGNARLSAWVYHLKPYFGNNFIDANFFDRTGSAEDAAVDQILEWAEDFEQDLSLLLPYSVQAEIEHPNTPAEVKHKARSLIYSIEVELTPPELTTHARIAALIQGNAKTGQHAKDAFHLVESQKNGGRHFITNDQRLLRKAPGIWDALQIKVLKPSDFVNSLLAHIKRGCV